MSKKSYLFTSESVSEGHPDKVCDRISDMVVDTYLSKEPLARVAKEGELFAYKHEGFWQCMDTKRDRDNLEEIYKKGVPWIT